MVNILELAELVDGVIPECLQQATVSAALKMLKVLKRLRPVAA